MLKAGTNTFFSSSFFIFMIRFFPLLANLLVIIFFSRLLDEATYGVYQNFWIQLYLLNPVACLGIHVLIVTYAPTTIAGMFHNVQRRHVALFIGWIILISGVFAFLRADTMDINALVPFCFLLFYAVSLILESVLIAFRKFTVLIITSISYAAGYALLHWNFIEQSSSANQLFAFLAILIFLKLCVYTFVSVNAVKQTMADAKYSLKDVRSLWTNLGFYDVSQMVFRWVDKFIISLLLAEQLSAIYFNGSIDIPFFSVILGAVGSAALMQLANSKQDGSIEHTIWVSNYSSRLLSAVVFPMFFFFFFFSEELFVVLLSDKYLASVPIFNMAILVIPLYAYHLTAILQNRHKGGIINLGAILDLLIALTLMYPLYQWLGLPGVALSFVVSSYLQAVFYLYHTGKMLKVSVLRLLPVGNWLLKLITFFILFIGIHYLLGLYFTQQIVLILGGAFGAIVCVVSLVAELKYSKQKYGNAFPRT